ncbi:hypothetical protein EX30DRAFT_350763 [Ascodesmis nigricans]|uniref:Uncharacterized protein n=1 Tax=Ascodesmis nigricans TaxID=341454 RepID=A0A4S2MRM8_9PEZI|nr:hypothetical protein EX30DRAFT_350763 [Ascodesmis nigricans]
MMLGTILPLLLMYIETSFTTITICAADPTRKHPIMLDYYGSPEMTVPVELASHSWEPMAKNVVYNEFVELMNLIRKIEGILQKKYQNAPPQLNAIANGDKTDDEDAATELVVSEMKDSNGYEGAEARIWSILMGRGVTHGRVDWLALFEIQPGIMDHHGPKCLLLRRALAATAAWDLPSVARHQTDRGEPERIGNQQIVSSCWPDLSLSTNPATAYRTDGLVPAFGATISPPRC